MINHTNTHFVCNDDTIARALTHSECITFPPPGFRRCCTCNFGFVCWHKTGNWNGCRLMNPHTHTPPADVYRLCILCQDYLTSLWVHHLISAAKAPKDIDCSVWISSLNKIHYAQKSTGRTLRCKAFIEPHARA